MIKKQTLFSNFLFFLFLAPLLSSGQPINQRLTNADSLFKLKKYTESLEIYEQILSEEDKATPQMLLKMAFIKEGLGDYSQALVYLNKYYLHTSDQQARTKMQDIAEENELEGYDSSDTRFVVGLINRHFAPVIGGLLLIAGLLLGNVVYRKVKKKGNATPYAFGSIVILVCLAALLNLQLNKEQVIIIDNHAYIMSGPSSGADLIDVVKKGHRVELLDEQDPWVKIDWKGKEAYIRKNKVRKAS